MLETTGWDTMLVQSNKKTHFLLPFTFESLSQSLRRVHLTIVHCTSFKKIQLWNV